MKSLKTNSGNFLNRFNGLYFFTDRNGGFLRMSSESEWEYLENIIEEFTEHHPTDSAIEEAKRKNDIVSDIAKLPAFISDAIHKALPFLSKNWEIPSVDNIKELSADVLKEKPISVGFSGAAGSYESFRHYHIILDDNTISPYSDIKADTDFKYANNHTPDIKQKGITLAEALNSMPEEELIRIRYIVEYDHEEELEQEGENCVMVYKVNQLNLVELIDKARKTAENEVTEITL